jgi:hypothetical protein
VLRDEFIGDPREEAAVFPEEETFRLSGRPGARETFPA